MSGELGFDPEAFEAFARSSERRAEAMTGVHDAVSAGYEVPDDAFGRIPFVSGDLRAAYTELATVALEGMDGMATMLDVVGGLARTSGEALAAAEESAGRQVGG